MAPANGATMFVEVIYPYRPIVRTSLAPQGNIQQIASMMVRDNRDLSDDSKNADGSNNANPLHPNGVYKVAGVAASTC